MSLSAASSWGTEPTNPTTLATMNAFVKSQTIVLSGTVGASDIASAAITSSKVAPEAFLYSGSSYSGGVFTISTANSGSTSFENGLRVVFKASAVATADDQVNVNSQGTKKLYRMGGTVRVKGGDFRANTLVEIGYNTSLDASAGGWEILSVLALPDVRYESTTTTGTNDYVATFAPTVPALVDGTRCMFKVPNTNTGASTFAPDGLTAKGIRKNFNQALSGNEMPAGAIVELVYDSTNDWWQLLTVVSETDGAAVTADARNLRVAYSTAARVTATADEVVLKNSGGSAHVSESVSVTIDMASSGANGLDTGVEANSTWYAIWLIYNPTTGVTAGLFSTSTTSPTLPSGYTFKGLVGYVYNSSGGNFTDFQQFGRRVWTTLAQVHGAVGPTSPTAVALTAFVPPAATEFHGVVGTSTNHATAAGFFQNSSAMSSPIGAQLVTAASSGAVGIDGALYSATQISVPLRTSQQFYWQVTSGTPTYYIGCTGFTF